MRVLEELRDIGYEIAVVGENLKLTCREGIEPPREMVRPLLHEVRVHKPEIINYLIREKAFETNGTTPEPFIDNCGMLVIPFDCHPRYHWWAGGQSVTETIEELEAI